MKGFSPPTRIFEAAGSASCLITDAWEGIETFLEPDREVLVARNSDDVIRHLRTLGQSRARQIGVAALQIPFLVVAANLGNVPLLLVAGLMMFTIFGAIPITDTLVARNTSDRWRSRIYAIKTGGGLAVSAVAVPLISVIYGTTQEFVALFALFAVLSFIIGLAGGVLPREGRPGAVAPAPSAAGS